MNNNIKISIVIATYNAGNTIERCINSIIPQLDDNSEFVIIDGGSTDATLQIINKYKKNISYTISEPDKGIYDAWNKGIKASKGEWILFIGADDMLEPDALKNYREYLASQNEKLDFVSGRVRYVDEDGRVLSISGKQWKWSEGRKSMGVTHVASITSRQYLERVNFFDAQYKIVGDYHLLIKGGKDMKAGFVNKIVATMATGGASFSVKALKEQLKIKLKESDIPHWRCYWIYLQQLVVFKTYNLRHKKW